MRETRERPCFWALLAAYFGAVPLAALPRPETWALMPRHVDLTPGGILRFIDYFGTALFAQAGVLTAGSTGASHGCDASSTLLKREFEHKQLH